jgi:hypothetical protein
MHGIRAMSDAMLDRAFVLALGIGALNTADACQREQVRRINENNASIDNKAVAA